jgi:hypothetical protein
MNHKVYKKIRSFWHPETEWILEGIVYVQEKIDWANLSIWRDWDWFYVWSRTKTVWTPDKKEWFRGAVEYINKDIKDNLSGLFDLLEAEYNTKDIRLYWERLIRHTIWNYNFQNYNHFYLFDIEVDWEFIEYTRFSWYCVEYDIRTPKVFWLFKNPSVDEIEQFVWKSNIWPDWEWIVIKNFDFINKFWDKVYAKIVSDKFKENNLITFWGCQQWDNEVKIVLKYCTDWRIRKIINKIEQNEDKNISLEDISKIIWYTQHDIITEEVWNFHKYWVINFKRLKWLIAKRTASISLSIINWEPISVAFDNNN